MLGAKVVKSDVILTFNDLLAVFHSFGVVKHKGDSVASNTPSLSSSISCISKTPSVSVSVSKSIQTLTAPFWLVPIAWPVPAIAGTPKVGAALETEPDKAPVPVTSADKNAAPPSIASEQPSPSASMSRLFAIPSLSVSQTNLVMASADTETVAKRITELLVARNVKSSDD